MMLTLSFFRVNQLPHFEAARRQESTGVRRAVASGDGTERPILGGDLAREDADLRRIHGDIAGDRHHHPDLNRDGNSADSLCHCCAPTRADPAVALPKPPPFGRRRRFLPSYSVCNGARRVTQSPKPAEWRALVWRRVTTHHSLAFVGRRVTVVCTRSSLRRRCCPCLCIWPPADRDTVAGSGRLSRPCCATR